MFLKSVLRWIRRGNFLKIVIEFLLRMFALLSLALLAVSVLYFWIFNFPDRFLVGVGLLYFQLLLVVGFYFLFQILWLGARQVKLIDNYLLTTVEIFILLFRLVGEISLLFGFVWGVGGGILGFLSRFIPDFPAAVPYLPFHLRQNPGMYMFGFISGALALFALCYLISELLLMKLKSS